MHKPSNKGTHEREHGMRLIDEIVHSVVGHLRDNGFTSIKAATSDFPSPPTIKWDEDDEGWTPHITCEHSGCTYVFEIETREAIKPEAVEDKWRLFSVFARRHKGKFYLIIPEKREAYLQEVLNELDVHPDFLKLRGIE